MLEFVRGIQNRSKDELHPSEELESSEYPSTEERVVVYDNQTLFGYW